ncbi:MAG: hypothetical protein K6G18_08760 [Treponema sp.]|nr:hypothetical protein [Treponema sp.]
MKLFTGKNGMLAGIVVAFICAVSLLVSCDYWKEDFYKNNGDTKDSSGFSKDENRPDDQNVNVDNRSILIRDSDTGRPVSNAQILVQQNRITIVTLTTGDTGIASFAGGVQLADGVYLFIITRDGYMRTEDNLTIANNGIVAGNQISLPKTINEPNIKIVLDWGLKPYDLDSHIRLRDYHVYYANPKDANGALDLDRDDVTSYGPETITIRNIDSSATYKYYVHNYSESPEMTTSGARVRVYVNNVYRNTYTIPTVGSGLYWHVFDITGGNNFVNGAGIVQSEPQ